MAGPSREAEDARPIQAEMQGLRAGFVSRVSADLVDGAVVLLIGGVVTLMAWMIRSLVAAGAIPRIQALGAFGATSGLLFVYLAFFWAATGRTIGKQLVGLRLVASGGGPVGIGRAVLRAAFCVVFPVGLLWVLVSRRNASVQDVVLRTAVVYDWRVHRQVGPMAGSAGPP